MSSAKKIGLVAITLAVGLTVVLISDRFKETTTPDRPKKESETRTAQPIKKENNTVKPQAEIQKDVDVKHEASRKTKQQPTRIVSSVSTSNNSVADSKPSVPVITQPDLDEGADVDEESKENKIVKSELPEENVIPKEEDILSKKENVLEKPTGKYFKFEVSSPEASSLPAIIHSVDLQKGRDLAAYKTDSYIDIPPYKKSLTLVCGVFGYKLAEKIVDYNNPALTEGAYQDEQGAWVIPYTLEPLAKGDVSVMYNVGFYKDAVVMLPQSKQELDQLVYMMQTNHDFTIKIHAHCNGKYDRKIIALGDPKNYFNVNGSVEIYGTAKQLSALRAEAVRSYLSENSIEPERLKTEAWGGSYQLVDENSPSAKLNDRIEIEILRNRSFVSAK